jgi:alginate O-acetyltransferase complex protein AlgI
MLFCSSAYLAFFLTVFLVYWAAPGQRFRVYFLLAASYFFYSSWSAWLAPLIFASGTLDYFLALHISAARTARVKKLLVSVSVIANVGLLCYFKYVDFFLDSLGQVLNACGASTSIPVLSIILPIGISFYTFEAINYVVDVYRGRVQAERNLANLLLFILFFPHLIAGPIVRARDFLPQIHRRKRWSWRRAQVGIHLILLGLIKKLVIADRLALLVDPVYADPMAYRASAAWLAVIGYVLQLYCDFSGYSDLAMGSAHLLGYRLAINFRMPLVAANMSDFWRRWHISLSTWLRDYLYIPLGGSRVSRWLTYRNLLITFAVCGLWHGASWTCVLFGVSNGIFLVTHSAFRDWCQARPRVAACLQTVPGTALRIGLTFAAFAATLIFFRCQTLAQVGTLLTRLVTPAPDGYSEPLPAFAFGFVMLLALAGHALGHMTVWRRWLEKVPAPALGAAYGLAFSVVLTLAAPAAQTFIYFQF